MTAKQTLTHGCSVNWYHSKTYQDLIPIRDQAADVVLISYEC